MCVRVVRVGCSNAYRWPDGLSRRHTFAQTRSSSPGDVDHTAKEGTEGRLMMVMHVRKRARTENVLRKRFSNARARSNHVTWSRVKTHTIPLRQSAECAGHRTSKVIVSAHHRANSARANNTHKKWAPSSGRILRKCCACTRCAIITRHRLQHAECAVTWPRVIASRTYTHTVKSRAVLRAGRKLANQGPHCVYYDVSMVCVHHTTCTYAIGAKKDELRAKFMYFRGERRRRRHGDCNRMLRCDCTEKKTKHSAADGRGCVCTHTHTNYSNKYGPLFDATATSGAIFSF